MISAVTRSSSPSCKQTTDAHERKDICCCKKYYRCKQQPINCRYTLHASTHVLSAVTNLNTVVPGGHFVLALRRSDVIFCRSIAPLRCTARLGSLYLCVRRQTKKKREAILEKRLKASKHRQKRIHTAQGSPEPLARQGWDLVS